MLTVVPSAALTVSRVGRLVASLRRRADGTQPSAATPSTPSTPP